MAQKTLGASLASLLWGPRRSHLLGPPSCPTHTSHSMHANVPSRFSCVRLFETPWTVACQAPCPWDSPGKNAGAGCLALLQGVFLTQLLSPHLLRLLHCTLILLRLSHQGSPTFPSSPSLQAEAGPPALDHRQSLPLPGSRFLHLRLPRGTMSIACELSWARTLSWP